MPCLLPNPNLYCILPRGVFGCRCTVPSLNEEFWDVEEGAGDEKRATDTLKAMAAVLSPNQLCACAHYDSATPVTPLSQSSVSVRSAAASAWIISIRRSSPLPRSRDDGTSASGAIPSTPPRFGRSGLFSKMGGVGWVPRGADIPRRLSAVKETKVVIMVDPVEAKRLAAAEIKAMQARAKLKRQKEIEAINGGWAMLGLTAGIVIDGYTGKSILIQIAGYLDAVADYLTPFIPS